MMNPLKALTYRAAFWLARSTAVDNDGHTYDEILEVFDAPQLEIHHLPIAQPSPAVAPRGTTLQRRDEGRPPL